MRFSLGISMPRIRAMMCVISRDRGRMSGLLRRLRGAGDLADRPGAGKPEMENFSAFREIFRNRRILEIPELRRQASGLHCDESARLPVWTKQGRLLASLHTAHHGIHPPTSPINSRPMMSPPSMNSEKPTRPSARNSAKSSSARTRSSSNSRSAFSPAATPC